MIWSTALSLVIGLAAFLTLILTSDPAQILALLLQTGWGLLLVAALHVPQIFCSALGWQPLIEDTRRPGLLTLTKLRWVRESANAMLPFVQVAGELARAQLLLRRGVGRIRVVASIAVDLATEMASQIVFSLMGVAVLLVSRTKDLLTGEGVNDATAQQVQELARQTPGVTQVRPPLTMYLAPDDVMLALDVDFDDSLTATQVETAIETVQEAIRGQYPEFKRIFIEAKSLTGR